VSKSAIDALGFAAGALTTGAALPQILHAWRTRSMRDVSVLMLLCMTGGIALWLLYGVVLAAPPLIVWNAVTLAFYGVLVAMKFGLREVRGEDRFSVPPSPVAAGGFAGRANPTDDAER
jgi:MtN3 and saliva related transmembrane protein